MLAEQWKLCQVTLCLAGTADNRVIEDPDVDSPTVYPILEHLTTLTFFWIKRIYHLVATTTLFYTVKWLTYLQVNK